MPEYQKEEGNKACVRKWQVNYISPWLKITSQLLYTFT
jgi:hypothetical protein